MLNHEDCLISLIQARNFLYFVLNRKYNVALPTSAAVERLFSVGGFIFDDFRSRLSDEHFDMFVWLYVNRHFFNTW